MNNNTIISLGGHIKTGKSTVSRFMKESLEEKGVNVKIIPVGKKIKEEVSVLYGIPLEIMLSDEHKYEYLPLTYMTEEGVKLFHDCNIISKLIDPKKLYCTPRQLCQIHASEIRRKYFGDDYWDNRFLDRINDFFNTNPDEFNIVLHDDLRFHSEVAILNKFSNTKLRLSRYPGYNVDISHSSERNLDDYTGWDCRFKVPEKGLMYLKHIADTLVSILLIQIQDGSFDVIDKEELEIINSNLAFIYNKTSN